jgi:hypothetical protein
MPCRSGSPQGVFSAAAVGAVPEAAGPCACVPTTDKEMTPTAAPAMAAVIIEPENISRMMVSFFSVWIPDRIDGWQQLSRVSQNRVAVHFETRANRRAPLDEVRQV